ncbi:MAG: signal peptidase I [Ignavibacteria bacterium]|nr:signal peptidase I [Ignavibacteria bacterium]
MFEWIKNYLKKRKEKRIQKELKKKNRTPAEKTKDFFENLLWAAVAAFILKTFVIEAYRIPTGSMEDTLLVGDFLLVTKFTYGSTTPRYIPFTDIALPYLQLPGFKKVKRGDIVVFEYPGDRDKLKPDEIVNYIKRCVGLPGDTIFIKDKVLYVNGQMFERPPKMKFINPSINPRGFPNFRIFPKGSEFNEDNYGPLVVPKKGDVIQLSTENIEQWRTIIDREHGRRVVKIENGKVVIDGKPVTSYTLKKDYYFMMGDNRDDSADSRFWGFVPDDLIIGEALIVYWSWDPNIPWGDFFNLLGSVRLNRIAKLIY